MRDNNQCQVCGLGEQRGALECHHIVHRARKLLRWDVWNGVTVHAGTCHGYANLCGLDIAREEEKEYLRSRARMTIKQFLLDNRLSEDEWRLQIKKELMEAIGDS
jgi:hypothetical protein